MSNNFFNYRLADFYQKYGSDWDQFLVIMERELDYLFDKVFTIYNVRNITKMRAQALQINLNTRKVDITPYDTTRTKKIKLRKWVTTQRKKGLEEIYLDIGEAITGVRGILYQGQGWSRRWGYSRWANWREHSRAYPPLTVPISLGALNVLPSGQQYIQWSSNNPEFYIYFDVKTTNATELDSIASSIRSKSFLPAFYKIVLIDASWNFLRYV